MTPPARLMAGFPLAAHMPSRFFLHWLHMDCRPLVGAGGAIGVYVQENMALIVEMALAADHLGPTDRLVIIEHDMLIPSDAFHRIAAYESSFDIVGSMYFQRRPPHHANALMQRADLSYDPISPATVARWCAQPGLYPVDAVGLGLTSITKRTLANWPDDVPMFGQDKRFESHDLWFSHHARHAGFTIHVDSGVLPTHIGDTDIGFDENQRCAATEHNSDDPPITDTSQLCLF